MASTDAKPIPQKNVAYRVTFPIFDADGDLVTGASSLDSEISKDGGTFADCTNEATEIATSSGVYYLDLTSTEMNADTVAVIVKSATSGAKTTVLVMYPEEAGDIRVNVTQFGGTDGTFASGRPEVNTTHFGGSPGDFASGVPEVNAIAINGTSISTTTAHIGVNVVNAAGTAWGSGAITAASIATGAIDADAIATDAVTEIQSGLATASALATVDSNVDAIKAKTDSLTFTTAGQVDANIQYVNDVAVTGDGDGTPWGPA